MRKVTPAWRKAYAIRSMNPVWRKRLSDSHRGKRLTPMTRRLMGRHRSGVRNSQWVDGRSFGKYCIKFNKRFKNNVRAFFSHTCVVCGKTQADLGCLVDVHHVYSNPNACCDPNAPRYFVTLCRACHTRTRFNTDYWEPYFVELINSKYGGHCYPVENRKLSQWID